MRGEIGHAENCGHAAHARSGVGWQGGNWLLMTRINLFGAGNGFPGVDDPETGFRRSRPFCRPGVIW